MSLSITLIPAYQFPLDGSVQLAYSLLNLLGTPTVNLEGTIGTATLADGSVTTVKLADGVLSADAMGRAKMEDGYLPLIKTTLTFVHEGTLTVPVSGDEIIFADASDSYHTKTGTLASLVPTVAGQFVYTSLATYTTISGHIPWDDSIPQKTEGTEVFTVTITPKSATNVLMIEALLHAELSPSNGVIALFQDATADALAAASMCDAGSGEQPLVLRHFMLAGTTSPTTFKIRAGMASGDMYLNGNGSARKLGGVEMCTFSVREIPA